jgi:phage baseplate assembly protein W
MSTISLNISRPLTIGDYGAFDSDSDISGVIRQNLKNLLLTRKGERVHKRSFGNDIHRLLFEQKTEQLKISIAEEIIKCTSLWMSFISISSITVIFSGESVPDKFRYMNDLKDNECKIMIEYSFNTSSKTIKDILDLSVEIEDDQ